jgi:nicotinamide-nucleotide amidase
VSESAERIAELAVARNLTIAVAESLTGGLLSNRLAKGSDASTWFAGGVVAYTPETKQRVLGCTPGPVVTEGTACEMAAGVAKLLNADLAVAVTGVGGPDPQEGQPPGTVWIGRYADGQAVAVQRHFDGDPEQVCEQAADAAVAYLLAELTGS